RCRHHGRPRSTDAIPGAIRAGWGVALFREFGSYISRRDPQRSEGNVGDKSMQQYDYIVVGAGSAGAALASRLSENPSHQVLLVEAGGKTHFLSRFPLSFGLIIQKPGVNWLYQSEP